MKSSPTNKTVAIVLGAGKGSRSDLGYNKMFFPMGEKTVIQTAVDKFRIPEISEIIVVAAQSDLCRVKAMFPDLTVIAGGKTRSDSVRRALEHLESKSFKVALIHDGARPFVSQKLIRKVIKTAAASGSAIPVLPVVDALKEVSDGYIRTTLVRDVTACAQTPQGFEFMRIRRAYALTIGEFADDSEVYERSGYDPKTVPGEFSNVKLTYPHDFMRAEFMSVGYGFDVHQLREGRPLILGGVTIPYERGLYGHSDADVLIHAVIDAVLASAGLPDIGVNFPDTDPQYKDISSAVLPRACDERRKESRLPRGQRFGDSRRRGSAPRSVHRQNARFACCADRYQQRQSKRFGNDIRKSRRHRRGQGHCGQSRRHIVPRHPRK